MRRTPGRGCAGGVAVQDPAAPSPVPPAGDPGSLCPPSATFLLPGGLTTPGPPAHLPASGGCGRSRGASRERPAGPLQHGQPLPLAGILLPQLLEPSLAGHSCLPAFGGPVLMEEDLLVIVGGGSLQLLSQVLGDLLVEVANLVGAVEVSTQAGQALLYRQALSFLLKQFAVKLPGALVLFVLLLLKGELQLLNLTLKLGILCLQRCLLGLETVYLSDELWDLRPFCPGLCGCVPRLPSGSSRRHAEAATVRASLQVNGCPLDGVITTSCFSLWLDSRVLGPPEIRREVGRGDGLQARVYTGWGPAGWTSRDRLHACLPLLQPFFSLLVLSSLPASRNFTVEQIWTFWKVNVLPHVLLGFARQLVSILL